mmetsp:Transcript_75508/g.120099  ORF Transcript_75508/g.120099 Transcript_75508/m.120099 type:complete len:152 (+) Transcript_75508:24-479(+)
MATSSGTKYCISCGYALSSSARFCSSCGTQQQPGQDAYVPLGANNEGQANYGGYNNPANNVVVVEKHVVVQPAGVHNCSYKHCRTVTTAVCQDCRKWTCQVHLRTVRGYTRYSIVTVCPDCRSKRNGTKCIWFIVMLVIFVIVVAIISSSQ